MSLPNLNGQRIAIIGGSSGIGYAVAECALAEGALVERLSTRRSRTSLKRRNNSPLGCRFHHRESYRQHRDARVRRASLSRRYLALRSLDAPSWGI